MRFCGCELAQSYARVSTITGQADVFKSRSNFLTRSACFVNHCIDLKRKTSVVPGLGLEVGGKLPRSRRHRHAIDRIVRNRCCRSQSAFQHFTVGQRKLLPAMRCFPQCRNREPGPFLEVLHIGACPDPAKDSWAESAKAHGRWGGRLTKPQKACRQHNLQADPPVVPPHRDERRPSTSARRVFRLKAAYRRPMPGCNVRRTVVMPHLA